MNRDPGNEKPQDANPSHPKPFPGRPKHLKKCFQMFFLDNCERFFLNSKKIIGTKEIKLVIFSYGGLEMKLRT